MKDNWLNKLIVAVVLFVAVIIVGLLTMRSPELKYELTEQQTLASVAGSDEQISPERAREIQLAKDPSFQFIDLRSPDEFIKGHFEGALNIPLSKLLSEENLELIKDKSRDNKTLVLYATDQLQATAPWLLLKQMGFGNTKVLQGGYSNLTPNNTTAGDSLRKQSSDAEAAHYNFAELGKGQEKPVATIPQKSLPQKVVIKPKPKSAAPAAGGC